MSAPKNKKQAGGEKLARCFKSREAAERSVAYMYLILNFVRCTCSSFSFHQLREEYTKNRYYVENADQHDIVAIRQGVSGGQRGQAGVLEIHPQRRM